MAHPGLTHSDPLWYKDAIIYELHVRAFYDSNGDGIGDFPGLTQKLDYLQALGITALWLLPFYPSPRRDDGYDVADYQNVHPAYGTLGDECHMAYHFPLVPRLFLALDQEDRTPITDMLQQTPTLPYNYQWALFLRNHDAMGVKMLTDAERQRLYQAYAPEPRMLLHTEIRRRLAPLVQGHLGRIQLLHSLLFSLPGTPILYYGDEIGMGDNVFLDDRAGVRTPMQWSGDRNAGFSRADSHQLYAPVITDPVYGYQAINVESQERDPASLLRWMKCMIALRKQHPVFGRGEMTLLHPRNRAILAYIRHDAADTMLIVANVSSQLQQVELDLTPYTGMVPREMLREREFPPIGTGPYVLTLGPYACSWFLLQIAA